VCAQRTSISSSARSTGRSENMRTLRRRTIAAWNAATAAAGVGTGTCRSV